MELIGKLESNNTSKIGMIPSASKEVSIKFEDQCIHIYQYRPSVLQSKHPPQLQQTARLHLNATPHKYQLTDMESKGKGEDGEGYTGGLNGTRTAN